MKGNLFDIQRFSIGNGPGVRTTVFFKGCSLRCKWCHNPESLAPQQQIRVNSRLCRGCGMCAQACGQGVHEIGPAGVHSLRPERCTGCGRCVAACCYGCVALVGRAYTPDEVAEIVCADRAYYEKSGGGLTFSGGEPMLQYDFAEAVMERVAGTNVYMDTSGHCPKETFARMLCRVDGVLFDLKHMDSARHKALTGAENSVILENFAMTAQSGVMLRVRYPMIPGENDGAENIAQLCGLLERYGIRELDVSPYHDFGTQKYRDMGMEPPVFRKYTQQEQEERLDIIREFGIKPIVI